MGTSPEFDFALYTLCFLTKYGSNCKFTIGDCISVKITTFDKIENEQRFIATAYPSTIKSADNCTVNSNFTAELFTFIPIPNTAIYFVGESETLVMNDSIDLFPKIFNFLTLVLLLFF